MQNRDVACVILAGGRGNRMASSARHKVCFPVHDIPAIVRAIDTYKQAGLRRFLVVVGQMAEQVIATVAAAHPETTFVFQTEPRGTGHAALTAAEALAAQSYAGPVLVTMGDKVTRADVVARLLARFEASEADMLLTTLPKAPETTAGRAVEDGSGNVLGIVETADIREARERRSRVVVGGRGLSADEVEQSSPTVNASLYVFRFGALQSALRGLSPANAQGELYLTDVAEIIAGEGRAEAFALSDPDDLMAFNTPAELLAVERVVSQREGVPLVAVDAEQVVDARALKPAGEWLALLEDGSAALLARLREVYGTDRAVLEERRSAMAALVRAFVGQFGPTRRMVLCRAPGRVNLMGRHVDHRGGYVNVMAINKEALLAASPRHDDLVRLRHLDIAHFPNREFRISDLLRDETWSDWMDFLDSRTAREVLDRAPGDWSHYVRAPLLRLQYERRNARLKGMDCMVGGNIPMGAGLSSSSALVVAFAEAAVVLNDLDLAMRDFVDLCGEGEWFVGSRGGSADHAAIRTGQLGHISRIGFFPFRLAGDVPFPDDLRVIVAHSGAHAVKSAGARDVFNQRVASYGLAELLLRQQWPAAGAMEHLRDLAPDHLKVEPADIYRALAELPEQPTRRDLAATLHPDSHERMQRLFDTHADPGTYDLRGVTLFGISECMRSEQFADTIARGDLAAVSGMMEASHDGDRTHRHSPDGQCAEHVVATDAQALSDLARRGAPLIECSGRYACSTEAIDCLVDLANSVDGVIGSQLAGAGLGGCMMIVARTAALERIETALSDGFYAPRGLSCDLEVCTPVAGAGLMSV